MHTESLGLITPVSSVGKAKLPGMQTQLLLGPGSSPRLDLAKSAPGQGHGLSFLLSFPEGLGESLGSAQLSTVSYLLDLEHEKKISLLALLPVNTYL